MRRLIAKMNEVEKLFDYLDKTSSGRVIISFYTCCLVSTMSGITCSLFSLALGKWIDASIYAAMAFVLLLPLVIHARLHIRTRI